jgi:hypothetical protein
MPGGHLGFCTPIESFVDLFESVFAPLAVAELSIFQADPSIAWGPVERDAGQSANCEPSMKDVNGQAFALLIEVTRRISHRRQTIAPRRTWERGELLHRSLTESKPMNQTRSGFESPIFLHV